MAELQFATAANLLSFFGVFYMATSVGTLLVQLFLARHVLQKIGLGAAMVSLPAVLVAAAGIGMIWTRLATVVLAKALERVLANSVFRSGYELLYAPIAPSQKRSIKAFIDVACDKVGDGIGSLIVLALIAVTATPAISWALFFAVVASIIALTLTLALRKGYVEQLAVSLRAGSVDLGHAGLLDLTTRHSLTTTHGLDPETLASIIESATRERAPDLDWRKQFQILVSGKTKRILDLLSSETLSPRVGQVLIEFLAEEPYARPAQNALGRLAPRMTGQIVDALLDPTNPQVIRRRIPRVLLNMVEPRAIEGLLEGLRDRDPKVRFRCAQALSKTKQAHPELTLPESHIFEMIQRETHLGQRTVRSDSARDLDSEVNSLLEKRGGAGLEHICALLSLVFDRRAIVMSFRALNTKDASLRGTALEYLSQVLPEHVRTDLWPRLVNEEGPKAVPPTTRDATELLHSMESSFRDSDAGD